MHNEIFIERGMLQSFLPGNCIIMKKLFIYSLLLISTNVNIYSDGHKLESRNNTNTPKCLKNGEHLYNEIICQPLKKQYRSRKNKDQCPTSYDCNHIYSEWEDYDHCIFQDSYYWIDQLISFDATVKTCLAGCRCTDARTRIATIICAEIDCPENYRSKIANYSHCIYTYDLNSCCAVGLICPPFAGLATCNVDGVTYYEGQEFYPENTCFRCLCKKGFKGKYVKPYCEEVFCGVELRYHTEIRQFCAPVYHTKKSLPCCPITFTCAKSDANNPNAFAPPPENFCKYGTKLFKIGDTFEEKVQRSSRTYPLICKCVLPPLLFCTIIQTRHG